MAETLPEAWAYHGSECPLTHEAQALELFNRALARAMAACDADKLAAMAHALLFAGCSRLAAEVMESGAEAGLLPPQDLENVSIGLRLAEPIVVRLAQSNVTPRMVVEVLALWVRKAAGGGPAGAKSVFSERPTLEPKLYSGDMRAGLRAAPSMASSDFAGPWQACGTTCALSQATWSQRTGTRWLHALLRSAGQPTPESMPRLRPCARPSGHLRQPHPS